MSKPSKSEQDLFKDLGPLDLNAEEEDEYLYKSFPKGKTLGELTLEEQLAKEKNIKNGDLKTTTKKKENDLFAGLDPLLSKREKAKLDMEKQQKTPTTGPTMPQSPAGAPSPPTSPAAPGPSLGAPSAPISPAAPGPSLDAPSVPTSPTVPGPGVAPTATPMPELPSFTPSAPSPATSSSAPASNIPVFTPTAKPGSSIPETDPKDRMQKILAKRRKGSGSSGKKASDMTAEDLFGDLDMLEGTSPK